MSAIRVHGNLRIGWNPWAKPDWTPSAKTWECDVVAVLKEKHPRAPIATLCQIVRNGLKAVPVHMWPWMDQRERACRLMENLFPRLRQAGFKP